LQHRSNNPFAVLSGVLMGNRAALIAIGMNAVFLMLMNKNEYDLSLDYSFPGKINGKDVYSHVRKNNKCTPVLFISGNIESLKLIKDLKQKDPNMEHFSKPCKNIEYVNRINLVLESKSVQ